MKNISQLKLTIKPSNTTQKLLKQVVVGATFTLLVSSCAFADSLVNFIPSAPNINAEAYILMDYNSGQILAESNADVRRDPASLTKMMTSYIIGQEIKAGKISLNDIVTVGRDAWATGNPVFKGSSLMFLKPGDKVKVIDLNRGIIIQSGNDACVAMADYIAGSQNSFVSLMNNYAASLGMTNSHFQTVHGLDAPGQYTSAKDMATLGRALISDVPDEYAMYKEKEFTYNKIRQVNRNGLLWDTSFNADGIKTGHTASAGYNLVASATQGNTRLVSVVLGGRTFKGREEESKKLLTWGFRFFESVHAVAANQALTTQRIWFGDENMVKLGSTKDEYLALPAGRQKDVKITYTFNNKELNAPLTKGQQVGTINFTLDDKVIEQRPLVALEDVNETGFFGRMVDHIKLMFYRWFN